MNPMVKERLHFFDVLKGMAIFMVVTGHVITYGIYRIDSSIVFRLIGLIHMPLFFFISGWFCFRRDADSRIAVPDLLKRALQLLLPMAVVSTLWICYYPHSGLPKHLDCTMAGLWGNLWKNGYWFTPVLFLIMALYAASAALSHTRLGARRVWPVYLALYIGAAALRAVLPESWNAALGLPFVVKYYPVFLFGAVAASRKDEFLKATERSPLYTISLAVTAAMAFVIIRSDILGIPSIAREVAQVMLHCSLAVVAIGVVRPWCVSEYAPGHVPGRGIRLWQYLGRNSLGIYLLHYFFLFPMGMFRRPLMASGLDFVPVLATAGLAACGVAAVCAGVIAIVGRSPLLSLLLLGNVPKRKPRSERALRG